MPWKVVLDQRCPVSRPYGVVKTTDGSLVACHATKAQGRLQQEALYAKEPAARSSRRTAPKWFIF